MRLDAGIYSKVMENCARAWHTPRHERQSSRRFEVGRIYKYALMRSQTISHFHVQCASYVRICTMAHFQLTLKYLMRAMRMPFCCRRHSALQRTKFRWGLETSTKHYDEKVTGTIAAEDEIRCSQSGRSSLNWKSTNKHVSNILIKIKINVFD